MDYIFQNHMFWTMIIQIFERGLFYMTDCVDETPDCVQESRIFSKSTSEFMCIQLLK